MTRNTLNQKAEKTLRPKKMSKTYDRKGRKEGGAGMNCVNLRPAEARLSF